MGIKIKYFFIGLTVGMLIGTGVTLAICYQLSKINDSRHNAIIKQRDNSITTLEKQIIELKQSIAIITGTSNDIAESGDKIKNTSQQLNRGITDCLGIIDNIETSQREIGQRLQSGSVSK